MIRNIAIIAHVDHGKTTLVDHMLRQTGVFREEEAVGECILDSNDLEKERGITILSKNASVRFRDTKINIIDTPGHHDFGGEVERVLRMATGALILVDATDGPMPQTRYVLQKALAIELKLIVVINKLDRPEARPELALENLQYMLLELDATHEQLDSPVIYAIGREGKSKRAVGDDWTDLTPLFETILDHVSPTEASVDVPAILSVSTLEYNDYVGRMAVGRISRGVIRKDDPVFLLKQDGRRIAGSVVKLETFENLTRRNTDKAPAGEIVCLAGLPDVDLGDTIAADENAEPLPFTPVDVPTMTMYFLVNDSPLSGKEGEFLTSSYILNRLKREALADPALCVEPTDSPDRFMVSGRGLLHLSILIEKMRRDGFELQVSRPEIIFRHENGKKLEPIERAEVNVPEEHLGKVMELLGTCRGEIESVTPQQERVHVTAKIPTRALMGLQGRILSATRGHAVLHTALDGYGEYRGDIPERAAGAIVAQQEGLATTYALDSLGSRGVFFVSPGTRVYEGMIVGEHVRETDIVVNAAKTRKLTNMRAASADQAVVLAQPRIFSLEQSLEFINPDELVEVTPKSLRLRKKMLRAVHRKRAKG